MSYKTISLEQVNTHAEILPLICSSNLYAQLLSIIEMEDCITYSLFDFCSM